MPTPIDTGDIFRLRNDSTDADLVIEPSLLHKGYRIAPGRTGLVPFDIIRIWWGDPRSRWHVYTKFSDSKESGWVNKREDEIRRLGVLYGSYANDVATLLEPEHGRGSPHYGEPKRVPHPVSVQTESGESIVPACFDLGGDQVFPAVYNKSEEITDEVAYRQYLEKRLDEMKAELNRLSEPADDAEVDRAGK